MVQAGKRFLETLREVDVDRDCEISLKEFKQAFDKVGWKLIEFKNAFDNDC